MHSWAFFVGTLVTTSLFTLISNWLLRHYAPPIPRLMLANGLSLFVATVVGGFDLADAGDPKFAASFSRYVLAQIVWLIVEIITFNRRVENKASLVTTLAESGEPLFAADIPIDPVPYQVPCMGAT